MVFSGNMQFRIIGILVQRGTGKGAKESWVRPLKSHDKKFGLILNGVIDIMKNSKNSFYFTRWL